MLTPQADSNRFILLVDSGINTSRAVSRTIAANDVHLILSKCELIVLTNPYNCVSYTNVPHI